MPVARTHSIALAGVEGHPVDVNRPKWLAPMTCVNAPPPGPGAPRDLQAMVPTLVQALKDAKDPHYDGLCGDPEHPAWVEQYERPLGVLALPAGPYRSDSCTCPLLTRGNPVMPVAPPCRGARGVRAICPGTRTGAAAVHTRHGTHEPAPA